MLYKLRNRQREPLRAIPACYMKQLTPQLQNGGVKNFYTAPTLMPAPFVFAESPEVAHRKA